MKECKQTVQINEKGRLNYKVLLGVDVYFPIIVDGYEKEENLARL